MSIHLSGGYEAGGDINHRNCLCIQLHLARNQASKLKSLRDCNRGVEAVDLCSRDSEQKFPSIATKLTSSALGGTVSGDRDVEVFLSASDANEITLLDGDHVCSIFPWNTSQSLQAMLMLGRERHP